jgi:hypothetical protein
MIADSAGFGKEENGCSNHGNQDLHSVPVNDFQATSKDHIFLVVVGGASGKGRQMEFFV